MGNQDEKEKQTKWKNNFKWFVQTLPPQGQKFVTKTLCDECTSPIRNRNTLPDRALHTTATDRDNPQRNCETWTA